MKLYSELADWFHLLTAPEDYAEEAEIYSQAFLSLAPGAKSILELGSGGGNNASWMKRHFNITLVDLSPRMLTISQMINPDLAHIQGDMRTVRLNRLFDGVFIHDAISYLTSREDLRQALTTAYAHCKPGGAAIFCPDYVRENFSAHTGHGGHDSKNGRGLRYVEWFWDPDPTDCRYVCDFAYLLREADGSVRVEHDRHELGLFATREWLDLIQEAGFEPGVRPFLHSEVEEGSIFFVGTKKSFISK
jgi:SAM-dependent methyltransferase